MPDNNSSLGTRLTIQALGSSAAANVGLAVPANYPVSPDVEVRGSNQVVQPSPSLMQRASDNWNTLVQKARLARIAMQGGDPNSPESQFYAANGYFPVSQPALTAQQAMNIRNRVNVGR